MPQLSRSKIFLFLAIIVSAFSGCKKDIGNQLPVIDINYIAEGLKVTLNGSVVDSDGTVSYMLIDWGDNKTNTLTETDFSNLNFSHLFIDPADYTIHATVKDNEGGSTSKSFLVSVDFKETLLDKIKPGIFKSSDKEYLILTINLHTYQETLQNEKFNMITDVIGKMDVDFIAFQECAQNKFTAITEGIIREDNMALIISNSLKEKYNLDYNFVWNWSHYGWSIWEEGVAILSKHELIESEDRYVSTFTGTGNITSRKVIYGSYQMHQDRINIFSAHTHWRTSLTDEEQNNQISKIKLMVDEKESYASGTLSIACGDFNGNPTSDYPWSEGYNTMLINGDYTDSFLEVYPDANNKPALSKYNTIGGDFPGRIDYIFMKKNDRYIVLDSQIIFTNEVVGIVSDHFGVLTKVGFSE